MNMQPITAVSQATGTSWRCAAFATLVMLVALASCQGDTTVLLRIEGNVPGGQALKLRVVDGTGALPTTYTFPQDGKPFALPGTIDFQVPSGQARLGVFVWVEGIGGAAVAHARSLACFKVAANAKNTATLTLQATSAAFTANAVQDCRCNGDLDMCDPTAVGAGGAGGTLATGGAGGQSAGGNTPMGTGGVAPLGGQGGAAADGGVTMDAGMGMGGSPVDADAPKLDAAPVITNGLFSFDTPGDWTSTEATVAQDTGEKMQGTGSIKFTIAAPAKGAFIRSRAFATNEVPGATAKLGMSVHVEGVPNNEANIQLWFECPAASVFNAYVQYKALAGLAVGWNQLTFDLPPKVVETLQGQHTGCKLWMDHQATGTFRYDNLGFL